MVWFQTLVFLLFLGALFAYLNERFLRLETSVGVMVLAMLVSCAGYLLDQLGAISWHTAFMAFWARFDFGPILLNGLLCFFLFAGALHIPIRSLEDDKWAILTLAVMGTLISTFAVAILGWGVLALIGLKTNFLYRTAVWRDYFADRPHCHFGNPQRCRAPFAAGNDHQRRIIV